MPKRTNLFQEVVEIIHRHMADDATVEASAMLTDAVTGQDRDVEAINDDDLRSVGEVAAIYEPRELPTEARAGSPDAGR